MCSEMAKPSLLHHDLFTLAPDRRGIYWLRLYHLPNGRFRAVLTEVPGNNGMSVISGASVIRDAIAKKFSIDHEALDLFIIWPTFQYFEGPIESANYSEPSSSGWRNVSRRKIEAVVGKLTPLPDHGVLFSQVLAHGGRVRESYRDVFEAVPVNSLPPPHAPYQCRHNGRFKKLLGKSESHAKALATGERFLSTLVKADLRRCRYHRDDWASIADASARIVDQLAGTTDPDYLAPAQIWRLPAKEQGWLVSLFRDPVVLGDDRASYVNGQHRGCALRFSGAQRAAVVVDTLTTEHEDADWTYLGDG